VCWMKSNLICNCKQYEDFILICSKTQVRLCRAKDTGEIFAMKKLKKSEMLSRGQVRPK
jgi:hypothetical protein